MLISALEIGFGLSATLMALVFALSLPRAKRVRIRPRDARSRRDPHA